jgi:DNA polymerase I-like protein with 3'-5' exonuclease and polymerase domains
MLAWRNRVAVEAQQTRVSRTFAGRRRRLLGEGKGVVREAYNHPLQGGVADILNLCTIQIAAALPGASLVYTVHDSAWWAVRAGDERLSMQTIRAIIEQKWSIGGVEVSIPAKFKDLRFGS